MLQTAVIRDHLQGCHVVGVYPMLSDETSWFLAVDFDGTGWKEDVAAFTETCSNFGLHPAVERSRCGNGAHIWFFFAEPIRAGAIRKMGCCLITETMTRRHELPMSSYDRLFPNQDTMPKGGFGNLIALPLQRQARQRGNTMFVDLDWIPYTDQWSFLASLPFVERQRVEALAAEATESGQIIGVRGAEDGDEDRNAPSLRLPSHPRPNAPLDVPLPSSVSAVLSQQVFVDKSRLPAAMVNQIKRLAAFQNPEFYKKEAIRLSTGLTPRVISREDGADYVGLPRGCLAKLESSLKDSGVQLVFDDQPTEGEPVQVGFRGRLTTVQATAARALLAYDIGVFVSPPGTGKTVVGTYLTAERARNTLVLLHRTQLLDQWRSQLSVFLDLNPKEIRQIGGGLRKATGVIDVAMIQSLVKREGVADLVTRYGHIIVDECHHVPAVSFERVMREVRARFITDLTATPKRRDGHHPILEFQLGPVRFSIDPRSIAAQRTFIHKLIVRETDFRLPETSTQPGIQEIYARLSVDDSLNSLILDGVI